MTGCFRKEVHNYYAGHDQYNTNDRRCIEALLEDHHRNDRGEYNAQSAPNGVSYAQGNIFERHRKATQGNNVSYAGHYCRPDFGKAIGGFHKTGTGNFKNNG